jgi:hypothetical protein
MSTKTTFKRIALVAVAALGLGVLSVAPSSASVSGLSVTVSNGTAAAGKSDSSTAATVSVAGLVTNGAGDSITVTFIAKDITANTSAVARLSYLDTTTSSASLVSSTRGDATDAVKWGSSNGTADSKTAGNAPFVVYSGAAGYIGATFGLQLESKTAGLGTSGVYTYTVLVSSYAGATEISAVQKDVTITIAALSTESKVASTGTSTAVLSSGSSYAPGTAGVDDVVGSVATASSTAVGIVRVSLLNAAGGNAQESVTATVTGPGVIGDGTTFGKSVVLKYSSADKSAGYKDLQIRADGSAGSSSIAISSTSVTFANKSVTFYSKSPKTITASINNPVLNVGANASAVKATAVDANGVAWTGQLYIVAVAAADALVGGSATTPKACTWTPAKGVHYCPITTLIAGTASFKVVDESLDTDADATTYVAADSAVTSDAVSVTVSNSTPASVKLAFDKATYAPFEKAIITVTPLDAAGKTMGSKTVTNLFATGGISSNVAFGSSSDTLTAVTLTTSADASSTAPRTAGAYTYVVYMPAQGTVTISATGGTGLASAGQVAVSASADVVNSSVDAATDAANEATDAANAATDAALAAADAADAATAAAQDASDAVAALSATVAKLVASLKAQITSLTNLVIKIQKKVRA